MRQYLKKKRYIVDYDVKRSPNETEPEFKNRQANIYQAFDEEFKKEFGTSIHDYRSLLLNVVEFNSFEAAKKVKRLVEELGGIAHLGEYTPITDLE